MKFGINGEIKISVADCEKLELALLAMDNIEVEETSSSIPFVAYTESYDKKMDFEAKYIVVSALFLSLCSTLNSVASTASKSVYGQQWGQKSFGGAGHKTTEKREELLRME